MSVELRQAEGYSNIEYVGLTKREQIAAMALQGMLAGGVGIGLRCSDYAEDAVKFADALLAELEK